MFAPLLYADRGSVMSTPCVCVSASVCVSPQVEKRLDLVKQVTHSTHKKLTACLQGQQGADVEKRSVKSPSVSDGVRRPRPLSPPPRPYLPPLPRQPHAAAGLDTADPSRPSLCFCSQKKLPLTILAQCLVEGAAVLGDDSLLG